MFLDCAGAERLLCRLKRLRRSLDVSEATYETRGSDPTVL